jgi:hypothetical protein
MKLSFSYFLDFIRKHGRMLSSFSFVLSFAVPPMDGFPSLNMSYKTPLHFCILCYPAIRNAMMAEMRTCPLEAAVATFTA